MTPKAVNKYLMILFAGSLILSIFMLRYATNWLTASSEELTALRAEVAVLDKKQSDLEIAKKALSDEASERTMLEKVLPVDKDQARVVQEIYAIADQSNITIDSVSFPSSTLGAQTAPKAAPTTETTATPTSTPTPDTTVKTTPTKSVSQATPVKDIPGVQSIELSLGTITSKDKSIKGVRYEEMMSLIKLIERNRRTMQIRTIGIGQSESVGGQPTYNLTLSVLIFIQP